MGMAIKKRKIPLEKRQSHRADDFGISHLFDEDDDACTVLVNHIYALQNKQKQFFTTTGTLDNLLSYCNDCTFSDKQK